MAGEPRPRLTELVFLARGPLGVRALAVIVVACAAALAGDAIMRLEVSLAVQRAAGVSLNPLQQLLAGGSNPRTAWIGWVAAACFLVAALRVRHGPVEPAAGRTPVERMTPARLRVGLRREYAGVRVLLVVVTLVAAVDAARTLALALSATHARASLAWSLVECLGLIIAAAVLALWASWFGVELRRLGALA